jgi:hypothetical protein
MSDTNRTTKRIARLAVTALIVVIAAIAATYLIGPATDPRTTASVSAPAHGEPENHAAPSTPSGGSKP